MRSTPDASASRPARSASAEGPARRGRRSTALPAQESRRANTSDSIASASRKNGGAGRSMPGATSDGVKAWTVFSGQLRAA